MIRHNTATAMDNTDPANGLRENALHFKLSQEMHGRCPQQQLPAPQRS